jgi:hypothetical protein
MLDVARFLVGEAMSLYCRAQSVKPGIRGEDMATIVLGHAGGATIRSSIGVYAMTTLFFRHQAGTWQHERHDAGDHQIRFRRLARGDDDAPGRDR